MNTGLSNPERLLMCLDENLDHEVMLVLYGRSGIALGFHGVPPDVRVTKDVDAIIRLVQLDGLAHDGQSWDARDAVDGRFKDEGLYITRLFQEDQVFLRPRWDQFLVPISRIPLIRHDRITAADMEPAFAQVRMPDIQELHDASARALPAVRALPASAAVQDYHLPHRLS